MKKRYANLIHCALLMVYVTANRSEFFTVHREKEHAQKMITEDRRKHEICSGSTVAKMTGLEICGEVSFTNASLVENAPYFPITGPMNAGITIYKRDASMTGYKFEARSTHVSIVRLYVIKYSFYFLYWLLKKLSNKHLFYQIVHQTS